MARPIRDPEKRFWEKIKVGNKDDCWEWQASKMSYGYGQFGISAGRVILAHRYSWMLHFGSIPNGLFVLHHCDNPACVNPNHLFIGTQKDNLHDMIRKGRAKNPPMPMGDSNPNAKLSRHDVKDILNYFERGLATSRELRKLYDISKTTFYKISGRKHWACQNL